MEVCAVTRDAAGFASSLVTILGQVESLELLRKSIKYLEDNVVDQLVCEETNNECEHAAGTQINRIKKYLNSLTDHSLTCAVPFGVLDIVFGYLDYRTLARASEICRSWRSLALDPFFWANFDPGMQEQEQEHEQFILPPLISDSGVTWDLGSLLRLPRFNQLHSLNLSPWKYAVDDNWIIENMLHLQSLRHLSLHNCSRVLFTHPDLVKLVNLTSINLGASQMDQLISNASLQILKCLTNLRKVDLHYCEKLNDYGLAHINDHELSKIQYLDLGNCYRLTSTALSMLTSLAPTLTWLSLKSPIRSNTSIKDDALMNLSTFSRLTHLDVGWCKRITDKGMLYLAKLTTLQYLGLAATAITDIGLHTLRNLKQIQVVDITNCYQLTTEAAALITINFPLIKILCLKGIPLGHHSAWNLSRLSHSKHLQELDFTNTYVTDEIMAIQHVKQAEFVSILNLSYCTNLTDLAVFNICSAMLKLKTLSLSHCHRMTNKALEYLPLAKNLVSVDVSGIYSLTEEALALLAKTCPNLKIIRK